MTLDDGKRLFDSFVEAEKVATKMSRSHNEGFSVYKVGNLWAIGGVHTKEVRKKQKIKSFDDIRLLLEEFKETDSDNSVEDYISEIENDSLVKESSIQGESDEWILRAVALKFGHEIDMSPKNTNTYLVLSLSKGEHKLRLKMGGNFISHIPLIKKQAESLIDSAVIWHTWSNSTSNWNKDAWFYRLERKD